MFVEKSNEELAGMSADNLRAYYMEKLSHEKTEIKSRLEKLEKENDAEKVSALETEIKNLKEGQISSLKSALEMQGVVLKKLQDGSLTGMNVHNAESSVKSALSAHAEDFLKAKEGRHNFRFSLKAAGDMTIAGNVSGGDMPQAQRLEGVNDIAEREAKTYALIPKAFFFDAAAEIQLPHGGRFIVICS